MICPSAWRVLATVNAVETERYETQSLARVSQSRLFERDRIIFRHPPVTGRTWAQRELFFPNARGRSVFNIQVRQRLSFCGHFPSTILLINEYCHTSRAMASAIMLIGEASAGVCVGVLMSIFLANPHGYGQVLEERRCQCCEGVVNRKPMLSAPQGITLPEMPLCSRTRWSIPTTGSTMARAALRSRWWRSVSF